MAPLVTVIVCTRARRDNVLATVNAILACEYRHIELLVVDQNPDRSACESLAALMAEDQRVRSLHHGSGGKATALNSARAHIHGEFAVLTDDDCEPNSDWIGCLIEEFASDPLVGCVFGSVNAPVFKPDELYVPICPILQPFSVQSQRQFVRRPGMHNVGMGANMAVRTDILEALGGWDPCCGPGERFPSGDDYSLAIRVIHAGFRIRFSRNAAVTHFGLRRHDHYGKDSTRWGIGSGATFAKYLRCGIFAHHSLRTFLSAAGHTAGRALRFQAPLQSRYPAGWLIGFRAGLAHPLDRRTLCFKATPSSATEPNAATIVLRGEHSQAE